MIKELKEANKKLMVEVTRLKDTSCSGDVQNQLDELWVELQQTKI